MIPVVFWIHTDADLSNMKFLVLALCVCAASAASFGYQPPSWQRQPTQQVGQAFASAAVTAPKFANEAVQQPFSKTFGPSYSTPVAAVAIEPVVSRVPVEAPIAAVAKAVYTAPITAAKAANYINKEAEANIVRLDNEVSAEGFNYIFETQNGIAAQSIGNLKNVNNEQVLGIQGSYQYTAPDGTPVQVSYIADENGYQPKSNLLPVGPPVPEQILRALEYIRTHPAKNEY